MKEPCIDCLDKEVDSYGYFCDLACGKRSAWTNHQAGIREVVEWFRANCPEEYGSLAGGSVFSAQLKDWGI